MMLTPNSALHESWREREARREADLAAMRLFLAVAVHNAAVSPWMADRNVQVAARKLELALSDNP